MKTIILYGMRASGKTSVGKLLAKELGYSFYDLDHVIADSVMSKKEGYSDLSNYINSVGWDEFRDEEYRNLQKLLILDNANSGGLESLGRVISLGGGAIIFERNRNEIFKYSDTKVIYVESDIKKIVERVTHDEEVGDDRPSLTGKSILQELEEVYLERKNIYENNCDFCVTNNDEVDKAVAEIAYKLTWGGICIPVTSEKNFEKIFSGIAGERKIEYVELRLDLFPDISYVEAIIKNCPKKVICTFRNINEGGEFTGTVEEQADVLIKCLDYGADYVDIELINYSVLSNKSQKKMTRDRLILSYHNFDITPELGELEKILNEMKKYTPAVYKIACMPQTLEDVERIYELTEFYYKEIKAHALESSFVFIAMGDLGLQTRYELPKAGSLLTFGAYGENISAPGQISYEELYAKIHSQESLFGRGMDYYTSITCDNLDTYIERYGNNDISINSQNLMQGSISMKKVLFLGTEQISGSLSPFMHNFSSSLLKSDTQKFLYTLCPTEGVLAGAVEEYVNFLESDENYLGGNVTMPYKIDMFEYLDCMGRSDERSNKVGAINTLYKKEGKIYGTNTDVDGVKLPILERLSSHDLKGNNFGCCILGSGGAARAAIIAVIELGMTDIYVCARNEEVLKELQEDFGSSLQKGQCLHTHLYDVGNNPEILIDIIGKNKKMIVINTLPFGFKDNLPESPIDMKILDKIIGNIVLYFEAVYDGSKGDTPLVEKLEEHNDGYCGKNIQICRGIEMLIGQAKAGFELWSNGGRFQTEKLKEYLVK